MSEQAYYAWSIIDNSSYVGQFSTIEEAKENAISKMESMQKLPQHLYIAHIEPVTRNGKVYAFRKGHTYEFNARSVMEREKIV